MSKRFRISFQTVSAIAHPEAYANGRACVPADSVPEAWWQHCSRESNDLGDIMEQADGCAELIAKGELIRNVAVEESTQGPWQQLPLERP